MSNDFMLGFLCGAAAMFMITFIAGCKDFKPDPCGAPAFKQDWPLNYPECTPKPLSDGLVIAKPIFPLQEFHISATSIGYSGIFITGLWKCKQVKPK